MGKSLFISTLLLVLSACSDFSDSKAGKAGEKCFGNGTCKGELICESGLCINPDEAKNDSTSDDDSDNITDDSSKDDDDSLTETDTDLPENDVENDDDIPDGWEKLDDDIDAPDPCKLNPCIGETNSTEECSPSGETYSCECVPGFSWSYGEMNCLAIPDPCLQGSVCVENSECVAEKTGGSFFTGDYKCFCNEGFAFDDESTACSPAYRAVSCGKDHVCAIDYWNKLYCWGSNFNGQLGGTTPVGNGQLENLPTKVNNNNWFYVSAGEAHTCAIDDGNNLYCWGYNYFGQIGIDKNGEGEQEPAPALVSASYNKISSGRNHTCAIKSDNKLYCWGWNLNGQLGSNNNDNYDTPLNIQSTSNWNNISAGDLHTCGIDSNSKLFCWGENTNGQLGDSSNSIKSIPVQVGTDMWSEISSGENHTCGIQPNNYLYCWGGNGEGQLGDNGSNTDRNTPYQIYNVAKKVSAGAQHTCSISTTDTLSCWGKNNFGQLGKNDTASVNYPFGLGGDAWMDVSAGDGFTCAIRTSGALYCWGVNEYGQIGIGTTMGVYSSPNHLTSNK